MKLHAQAALDHAGSDRYRRVRKVPCPVAERTPSQNKANIVACAKLMQHKQVLGGVEGVRWRGVDELEK